MYKNKAELLKMSNEEIIEYVEGLESNDSTAKTNGVEYVEWCGDVLDDVVTERGIDL